MKNGTIALWDKSKTNKGFRLFISKAIQKITGSSITHVGIWLNGMLYEQEKIKFGQDGLIITTGREADILVEPVQNLSDADTKAMIDFITTAYGGRGYNWMKLISLALVAPLKNWFNKIGWVPFDKPWFGEVCSVMPDEAYKHIGYDLFPGEHEGYTTPGDYLKLLPKE